ncbi:MAG: NAD(+)/NADH kinase [Lachnospiraceae bacterium]|nr:NAD(+)/NADH kinase [Lachnospiraceae bacterium]MDD3794488.1 NAD(+)/NADH kinase [Lachnospiraceae bacterium]
MNIFYVITNHLKDPDLEKTNLIKKYLEEKGKVCYVQDSADHGGGHLYKYTDASRIPKDVECVLVLGGDGTLLQASRDLVDTNLPLLGINMGTLGYLAEIEHQNIQAALDRLIADEYTIEDRMMITGSAYHNTKKMMQDMALNDIVIGRRGRLRVVDFNIYVNDTFLCSYRADGIILSTPTGSTGYSLSAGGPIVAPDASLILLTAIAPHTLNSRTIVLPDHVEVAVEVGGGHHEDNEGAEITFDGDTSLKLNVGNRIIVTKSEKKTHLIKINNTSFLEILRKKMN